MDQRIGILCGWGFVTLFGVGFILAGFIPPPSPSLGADDVAALYQANPTRIQIGMVIVMFGAALMVPFVAVISVQMRRMTGLSRVPYLLQLGAGSAGCLLLLLPPMLIAIAAFRPERDREILFLLHDVSWLMFLTPFPLAFVQNVAIATGIFLDKSPRPVFPRWVAYLNIWVALSFAPGATAFFFKSGPFAWNGVFVYWIPVAAAFIWYASMSIVLTRAVRESRATV